MKKLIAFILSFASVLCLGGCNTESASIGIIGGADGPTAVFVTPDINWAGLLGFIGIIAVVILAVVIIRRKRK